MLDLNQVAVFVHVARLGSFAEAARRIGRPANTVSRQVQELENQLGTRLMQRSTRKLTLTNAGRTFFEQCAPAVEGIAQAGDALIDGRQIASGLLRVAVPANFFDFFQVEWVQQFLVAHPAVRLQFLLSDTVVDLFSEGIDLAFRGGHVMDDSLVARKITDHHIALVASPAYLAQHGEPADVASLSMHQCLVQPHQGTHVTWRLDGPDGVAEVQVSGSFSADTAQTLLKACRIGLGVALLPAVLVAEDIEAGRLRYILPEYRHVSPGGYLVYLNRRHLPLAVSEFMEFMLAKIATLACTGASTPAAAQVPA